MGLFNMDLSAKKDISAKIVTYGSKISSSSTVYAEKLVLNPACHNLPDEYQEVEYLESDGTQYIDTGIYPTYKTRFFIKYGYLPGTQNSRILGTNGFYLGLSGAIGSGYPQICLGSVLIPGSSSSWRGTVPIPTYNDIVFVEKTSAQLFAAIDDDYYYSYIYFNSQTVSGAGTIRLFGTTAGLCVARIYMAQIDNKMLIPCYRKSDNKMGMYDIVGNEFYPNQGTGSDFWYDRVIYKYIVDTSTRIYGEPNSDYSNFEVSPINNYGPWRLSVKVGSSIWGYDVTIDSSGSFGVPT